MWQLLTCDIWRDGGSYSATLTRGEDTVSIWLQVGPWDHPGERTYEALFASDGSDPTLKARRIPSGEAERQWLHVLANEVSRGSCTVSATERFDELLAHLRNLSTPAGP